VLEAYAIILNIFGIQMAHPVIPIWIYDETSCCEVYLSCVIQKYEL